MQVLFCIAILRGVYEVIVRVNLKRAASGRVDVIAGRPPSPPQLQPSFHIQPALVPASTLQYAS